MDELTLTPQEALHALADGKVLENSDGIEIKLEGDIVVQCYTMGKHNTPVVQNYNGSYAGLMLPEGE
uniref:Uncharacterized protein n=1 Tax=uncultured bacterium contig00055 TaxID=1181539 RepID=A0A806KN25_9BACT|nr:hypothetical protein [uncultured bacterium contig00055]